MLEILQACFAAMKIKGLITEEEYKRVVDSLHKPISSTYGELTKVIESCLDKEVK